MFPPFYLYFTPGVFTAPGELKILKIQIGGEI